MKTGAGGKENRREGGESLQGTRITVRALQLKTERRRLTKAHRQEQMVADDGQLGPLGFASGLGCVEAEHQLRQFSCLSHSIVVRARWIK